MQGESRRSSVTRVLRTTPSEFTQPIHARVAALRTRKHEGGMAPLPPPGEWQHIDENGLDALRRFLEQTHACTASIGIDSREEVAEKLNVDENFTTHLLIMHAYIDCLWQYPSFEAWMQKRNISKQFLHALVDLHDYGRLVFNGPLPLTFIDAASDRILKLMVDSGIKEYMHTIDWVTGKEQLDSNLPVQKKIGLMLKAIDTLAKRNSAGELRNPQNFFAKGGEHDMWVQRQVENGRLPLRAYEPQQNGSYQLKMVSPEEYAANDKKLTLRGMQLIELISGESFSEILTQVDQHSSDEMSPVRSRMLKLTASTASSKRRER